MQTERNKKMNYKFKEIEIKRDIFKNKLGENYQIFWTLY